MKTLKARIVLAIIGGVLSFLFLIFLYSVIGWEFDPIGTAVFLVLLLVMELILFHTTFGSYAIWVPMDRIEDLKNCMRSIGFERDEHEKDKIVFVKNPNHFFKKRVFISKEDGQFIKGLVYDKIKDKCESIRGIIFIGS
jgi:hypothetical protein